MSFVEICFRLWSSALEGYKILKEKYSDNNAMGRTQTFDWVFYSNTGKLRLKFVSVNIDL